MFIMPHSCCVPQCTSLGNQSAEKPVSKFVTFHQFTKDKALRKKWIHAIRRDEGKHFAITHHTTICSRHFTDDCLVWTGFAKKRRTLKSNSVPSLFPWNDWGKQLPTPRRLLQRHVCPSQLITSAPLTCTLSALTPSSGSSKKTLNALITLRLRLMLLIVLKNREQRVQISRGYRPSLTNYKNRMKAYRNRMKA